MDARLYLVADSKVAPEEIGGLVSSGVGIVQLRERSLSDSQLVELAKRWQRASSDAGAPFIVNDRPDIAWAVGADGVHLGQDDVSPEVARRLLGSDAIIGRSTHTPGQVDEAIKMHADGLIDYMACGPVFETPTKPGRPAAGIDLISYAASKVLAPWFAIGGINVSNIGDVLRAGASRVVVVRAVTEAGDRQGAVRDLVGALRV